MSRKRWIISLICICGSIIIGSIIISAVSGNAIAEGFNHVAYNIFMF